MKHSGNVTFCKLITIQADEYNNSRSRPFKSSIAIGIVNRVLRVGGQFLKEDASHGFWYIVSMITALNKVAHTMRDTKRKKKNKVGRMCAMQEAIVIARANATAAPKQQQKLMLTAATALPDARISSLTSLTRLRCWDSFATTSRRIDCRYAAPKTTNTFHFANHAATATTAYFIYSPKQVSKALGQ